jgi:quercetin dioxygenase-like cupin family protein
MKPEQARSTDMASYTIKNMMDIEDATPADMAHIEGRFARRHLDSRELGVSLFRYAPGFRSPMGHSHREQEEVYVVISGSGRVKLDDDVLDVRQWDVVRVAPEVVRAFEAADDGLELIAVGGARPEEGDGVPVPGWWTD